MIWLLLAAFCFSFVVFFGAPFLPTLQKQKQTALDLLDLKKGQRLLELGSGDGRVARAAAERGICVTGYELNPILALYSYFHTFRYRSKVRIIWGNYWQEKWPPADAIYVFSHTNYMKRLDDKITARHRKIKLASVTFKVPGKKPVKAENGVFLYQY